MTFDDLLALAPTPAARERMTEMAEAADRARARNDPEAEIRLAEVARLLEEWGRSAEFPLPDRHSLSLAIAAHFD